jgi:hypothetical protein
VDKHFGATLETVDTGTDAAATEEVIGTVDRQGSFKALAGSWRGPRTVRRNFDSKEFNWKG